MATEEAIAFKEEQAFKSMLRSMERLAPVVDVAAVDVQNIYFPDARYQRAERMAALAAWMDRVATAVAGPETLEAADESETEHGDLAATSPLDGLTRAQLKTYAVEHGIDVGSARSKSEIADAIRAAQAERPSTDVEIDPFGNPAPTEPLTPDPGAIDPFGNPVQSE